MVTCTNQTCTLYDVIVRRILNMICKVAISYLFYWLLLSCSVMSSSFEIPWTVPCHVGLSMGFPRQEYWSGLPFPSPGHLPTPGIKPKSPTLHAVSLPLRHQGSPLINGTFVTAAPANYDTMVNRPITKPLVEPWGCAGYMLLGPGLTQPSSPRTLSYVPLSTPWYLSSHS